MIYLYCYLGIGAAVLAVNFISHRLTSTAADDRVSELLTAVDPERDKWWWKPLSQIVVPILMVITMIAVWPVAIYWKAKESIDSRRAKEADARKEFKIAREQLLKLLAVEDIEAAEIVEDPLGTTPNLPFGHLNSAWLAFKGAIRDGDAVWSFSATWSSGSGREELREGYVIVSDDAIGPHFYTRWQVLHKRGEEK